MFLQSEDHDINDFLSAVNFIAPQGFNLKYFIVPYAANNSILAGNAINNGFEQYEPERNSQDVKGITDTITYVRKDMKDRQSFNDSGFNLNQIPNEFPITRQNVSPSELEPLQTDLVVSGTEIKSPVAGVKVLESRNDYIDLKLEEKIGCFPKHSVLHFVKNVFKENKMNYRNIKESKDKDLFYSKIDELCERATERMEYDWEMSDDDRFAGYKDALFFRATSDGCWIKGRIIELIKNGTYFDFDVDYDWATGLWKELCKGLKMEELIDMAKNVSFIDEYTLEIKLK